jgi:hypothetical protein
MVGILCIFFVVLMQLDQTKELSSFFSLSFFAPKTGSPHSMKKFRQVSSYLTTQNNLIAQHSNVGHTKFITMITPEKRKPLSGWIRSFEERLLSGRQQLLDSAVMPADDYLIPALRIASSLAHQICKAEKAVQSPTPSSNWMESM